MEEGTWFPMNSESEMFAAADNRARAPPPPPFFPAVLFIKLVLDMLVLAPLRILLETAPPSPFAVLLVKFESLMVRKQSA